MARYKDFLEYINNEYGSDWQGYSQRKSSQDMNDFLQKRGNTPPPVTSNYTVNTTYNTPKTTIQNHTVTTPTFKTNADTILNKNYSLSNTNFNPSFEFKDIKNGGISLGDYDKQIKKLSDEYIAKYGYLNDKSSDDDKYNYYKDYLNITNPGSTEEQLRKMIKESENYYNVPLIGRLLANASKTLVPDGGGVSALDYLARENAINRGNAVTKTVNNLAGNTIGLALNPGGGLSNGSNLLNVTDDVAEGVGQKAAALLGKKATPLTSSLVNNATRLAVDGGIGGGLDTLRANEDMSNLPSNILQGSAGALLLGGAMAGGSKAISKLPELKLPNAKTKLDTNLKANNSVVEPTKVEPINTTPKIETPSIEPKSEVKIDNNLRSDLSKTNTNISTPKVEDIKVNNTMSISDRHLGNLDKVGNRNIKSLQYENAELKPFIQTEAKKTLKELNDRVEGNRSAIYDNETGETIITGTKKMVEPTIQAIQDLIPNVTYAKIQKGLNDIIEDNGKENNAIAKKIELILDDNLTNGSVTKEGYKINSNDDYIETKNLIEQLEKGDTSSFVKSNNEIAASKIEDNKGLSRFITETMPKSDNVSQGLKDINSKVEVDYDKISDTEALNVANERINKNESEAISDILSLKSEKNSKLSKYDVATGIELMRRLQNKGDEASLKQASDIAIKLSEELTKAGQTIQAASILNKLTPEGMLVYANRQIKKANNNLPKKAKKLELNEEEIAKITDFMKQAEKLPDGREKTKLIAQAHKVYQDKIPSSLMDKIDSFRYLNMLFNPKTLIKNAGGNVINSIANDTRDLIGTGIDKLISKKTGIRTTGAPSIPTKLKAGAKGLKNTIEDHKLGIDTSHSQREGTRRNALKGIPILGQAERLLSTGLELGDRPFYEATRQNFLNNYLKTNNIDDISKLPTEVLEEANKAGLEATYQQRTGLGNAINGLKNNESKGVSLFAKAIMPFSQTPAAILDTATNYTPLGAIRGINNIKKAITGEGFFPKILGSDNKSVLSAQREGVNQLASSILGTGLMAGGAALANNGVLTGALSEDKDARDLQKQTGMQQYALKLGDTYNSLEFGQPAATPLMMGADMSNGGKPWDIAKTGIESLMSNSFLSGLSGLGQSIGYNGWGSLPEEVAKNYISQLTPFSALSNQINKTVDPAMRDTAGDTWGEEQLNRAIAKYPILSQMLPQANDTIGNDKVYNEGMNLAQSIFNNFINPSTMTKFNPSEVEQNALDMYNETGDTKQMPRQAPDKITYQVGKISKKSKQYELTAEDKRIYNETIGNALLRAKPTPDDYYEAMNKALDSFKSQMIKKHNLK